MADIKVKESKKGTVKTINKAVVGTEKMKDRLVQAEKSCQKSSKTNEKCNKDYKKRNKNSRKNS